MPPNINIVLGLIFIKYISDAFEDLHQKLINGEDDFADVDLEDRDEYKTENVFYVPTSARLNYLLSRANLPEIGKDVNSVMDAIERDNSSFKDVLPKVYARANLDSTSLGRLIDLIGNIAIKNAYELSADV